MKLRSVGHVQFLNRTGNNRLHTRRVENQERLPPRRRRADKVGKTPSKRVDWCCIEGGDDELQYKVLFKEMI
jgi:hypothetical protein